MALTVELEEQGEILVARLIGQMDRRSDEAADRSVAEASRAGGFKALLIDCRQMEGFPDAFQSYYSGANLEERGFTREVRLAFLDRTEFKSANEFYETVAQNRGFQVRHFYSEEEALAWLHE